MATITLTRTSMRPIAYTVTDSSKPGFDAPGYSLAMAWQVARDAQARGETVVWAIAR